MFCYYSPSFFLPESSVTTLSLIYLGYIGYGAYVMHQEGRLRKKKTKSQIKKDKVKGGSIFEWTLNEKSNESWIHAAVYLEKLEL